MKLHPDIERLARLSWQLVPVTQRRCGFWKGYIDSATSNIDQLARWAAEYPGCNWSVVPEGSGVWALDVDVPSPDHDSDGTLWLRSKVEEHGPLPPGPRGRSGGGGFLLVFRDVGEPIRAASGYPAAGIDPRAGRAQFTVSPSVHRRTRMPYRWNVAPWEVSPPFAPEWLMAAVSPPAMPAPAAIAPASFHTAEAARRRLQRGLDVIAAARPGSRNDTLNRQTFGIARWIAAGLLDEGEAVSALYSAGIGVGLPAAEVRATIKSACTAGYRFPVKVRAHA